MTVAEPRDLAGLREAVMFLIEEIGIEVLMIAAVIGSIAILVWLLQVTVRERVYLRRAERERRARSIAVIRYSRLPQRGAPASSRAKADTPSQLRQKRA